MDSFNDVTKKHMLTVKEMGILEDEVELTQNELKEISTSLGMSESEWNKLLIEAERRIRLAESHFRHKSYRECIEAADEALLLNPFIKGARGWKAKALLLIHINEGSAEHLEQAEHQARLTLQKESTDKNAIEVFSTVSAKGRIKNKANNKKNWRTIAIAAGALIVMLSVFFLFLSKNIDSNISTRNSNGSSQVENAAIELQSAFEMQESLIPQIIALLSDNSKDLERKERLLEIQEEVLSDDITLKTEYDLQKELTGLLGEILVEKSLDNDAQILSDLSTKLSGAENRIKVRRKNYNKIIDQANNSGIEIHEKL